MMTHVIDALRLLFALPFFLTGFALRQTSTCIVFCAVVIAHGWSDAQEFWYLEHLKY